MRSVLDASALVAYIYGETGSIRFSTALENTCCISNVNWAEVLTKAVEFGDDPNRITQRLIDGGLLHHKLYLEYLNHNDCLEIARLRLLTRQFGLGLGDRACLALGMRADCLF